MKKIILSLFVFVLLGAGCTSMTKIEGDWFLAFDMPSEWIMVDHYKIGDQTIPSEDSVSREIMDVVIQSTDVGVHTTTGYEVSDDKIADVGEIITEDYTYIRVLKLDTRRIVPSEAEDLGNGFYKAPLCEDGDDCKTDNRANYDYYFVGEDSKYQFMIWQQSQEIEVAEEVILSAVEIEIED